MCLRLNDVEVEEGASETSEKCLEMVKEIFFWEMDVDVPDSVIDRAHRSFQKLSSDSLHGAIAQQFTRLEKNLKNIGFAKT